MANNREEAGKGTPRPGEMPASRRPYATIDARATEVEGPDAPAGMAKPTTAAAAAAKASRPSEPKPAADSASSPLGGRLAGALALLSSRRRVLRLATPLASGAIGALLVLGIAQLLPRDEP